MNWLEFLKEERAKYPGGTKWSTSFRTASPRTGRKEIRWWARLSNVVLVPTATHASWPNPVETHAKDIEELALPGQRSSLRCSTWSGPGSGGRVSEPGTEVAGKEVPGHRTSEPSKTGRGPVWLRATKLEHPSWPVNAGIESASEVDPSSESSSPKTKPTP